MRSLAKQRESPLAQSLLVVTESVVYPMMDVVILIATLAFFALAIEYIRGCESL